MKMDKVAAEKFKRLLAKNSHENSDHVDIEIIWNERCTTLTFDPLKEDKKMLYKIFNHVQRFERAVLYLCSINII